MKEEKDIFDLFRENQHKLDEMPRSGAWDKLERKLNENQQRTYLFTYRTLMAIAASVIIFLLVSVVVYLEKFQTQQFYAMNENIPSVLEDLDVYSDANEDILTIIEFQRSMQKRQRSFAINEGDLSKKLLPKYQGELLPEDKFIAGNIDSKENKGSSAKVKDKDEAIRVEIEEKRTNYSHTIETTSTNDVIAEVSISDTENIAPSENAQPSNVPWPPTQSNEPEEEVAPSAVIASTERLVKETAPTTAAIPEPSLPQKAKSRIAEYKKEELADAGMTMSTMKMEAEETDIIIKEKKTFLEEISVEYSQHFKTGNGSWYIEIPVTEDEVEQLYLVKEKKNMLLFENKAKDGDIKSIAFQELEGSTEIELITSSKKNALPKLDFWEGFIQRSNRKWVKKVEK